MEQFTKKDVLSLCDLTARQFQFYVDSKLVTTSDDNPGRGIARVYDKTNILEFMIISRLSRSGLTIGKIAGVLDFIRDLDIQPLKYRRDYYGEERRGYLIIYIDRHTRKQMAEFKFTMGGDTCVLTEKELSQYDDATVINFGDLCQQVEQL